MARQPVAELYVRSQGALVRLGPSEVARNDVASDDLRTWVDRAAVPWSTMVFGGMGTAVLGLVLASINPLGFLGIVAFSSMITLGGGLTFLGILKRKREQDGEQLQRALPAATASAAVLAERARRVAAVLRSAGDCTFEGLAARLRWTEAALIETLVYMKHGGVVEEDLNLDTGEWVYRVQDTDAVGTPAGPTLAERQARVGTE